MADPLREPGFLTPHQFPAVEAPGDFFLVACPGSGKTRAAAVRFARLTADGLRVAATSYTNVAADSVRDVVSRQLGVSVPPSSFIGTLHGLLLTFVFYPFGHTVMGCRNAPRIVPDESPRWPDVLLGNAAIRERVAKFCFLENGSVEFRGKAPRGLRSHEDPTRIGQAMALRLKSEQARRGLASPDDAMYWSLRILRAYPDIARAVGSRFDEIIVDEAQDTSHLQLACVELLRTSGLRSLVLVGDLDQSIYAFNGARPERCDRVVATLGLSRLEFNENHRSSQLICNVSARYRSNRIPDAAVGINAGCPIRPEVLLFDPAEPASAVDVFRERLHHHDLDERESGVLARTREMVDRINGAPAVEIRTRPLMLARVASALANRTTLTYRQVESIETLLAYMAWDKDPVEVGAAGTPDRRLLRQGASMLIAGLPALAGTLQEWIRRAAQVSGEVARTLARDLAHEPGNTIQANSGQAAVDASELIRPERPLRAKTIHGVKGETIDSVLVVADPTHRGAHDTQSQFWSRPLRDDSTLGDEEFRIVFVALTRAARYCAVALPRDTDDATIQAFADAGFFLPAVA